MKIHSGYKTITSIQFANVLWALAQGAIDSQCLRVYFACFVLLAVREAAKRSSTKRGKRPKQLAHYRLNEIERLTHMPLKAVKRSLGQLRRAGLVTYAETEINITETQLSGSNELLEILCCGRSPRRPIPVPRSILRFLAENRKAAVTKTIIGYLLRGLSLARKGGAIFNKGAVKVSWIASAFGLSERSVRNARAFLVQIGWIERDTHSYQRKLNRDGAYFVINLEWSPAKKPKSLSQVRKAPLGVVKRGKSVTDFAPLAIKKCTDFAPPYKYMKTSNEVDQYQKAQTAEPIVAGVCKEGRGYPQSPRPTLDRIQREDLYSLSCLEILYVQAIARGWVDASEAMALNFIAAAVRAREVGDDPARLFVTLVRRGLWHHITQVQEDHAHRALTRFREMNPDRFRSVKPGMPWRDNQVAA